MTKRPTANYSSNIIIDVEEKCRSMPCIVRAYVVEDVVVDTLSQLVIWAYEPATELEEWIYQIIAFLLYYVVNSLFHSSKRHPN